MTNQRRDREHGVALLFCLFALLILTAITAALIMLSGTETSVNYNYRTEETAFFAAKTGIYEALDRMQQSNANSIAANIPTAVPSATGGVLYILNSGSSLTVKPWDTTNTYVDDEFCHGGYAVTGMSSAPPDVPCTTVPTGTSWYTTVNSNYPWNGTAAAMPYEWVRINWKENSSQGYLSGGSTPTASTYSVNSTGSASTPVCWNGGSEVLLSTPSGVSPAYTSCEQYQNCGTSAASVGTPVLMITALAVTSNGSRQMVQAEAALTPPAVSVSPCGISDPYGFYAYGGTCANGNGSPFQLGGGGSQALNTDGYNSSNGGTYASTENPTGGSIGSNGSVWLHGHSVNVGGTVYVQNPPSGSSGSWACPMDFSIDGGPSYTAVSASSSLIPPVENIPSNSSGTNLTVKSSQTLTAGASTFYDNVAVSGKNTTLTLTAPGTYNFNCLSVGANATLTISPPSKQVTINITGNNCTSNNVVDFNSQANINITGGIAANFQIVYPGSGNVNLVGAPSAYGVIVAPKAAVTLHGGTDWYGSILANTIQDDGNVALHFDHALSTIDGTAASTATATASGSYNILSFRSLAY